jgi:ZIP family zinc transporter
MIYVSFVEIFQKGRTVLIESHGELTGNWIAVAAFFGGILLIAIIDRFIPTVENPHEIRRVEDMDEEQVKKRKLARMGVMTALAIGIHNFPEGLATFTAALNDPGVGLAIAMAIAIHNIPEGIAVSVPVYYATGSRKKAFWLSFSSGLAEPVGALFGVICGLKITTLTEVTTGCEVLQAVLLVGGRTRRLGVLLSFLDY